MRTGTRLIRIGSRFGGEGILTMASRMSRALKAAVESAQQRRLSSLFALLPAIVSLAVPATAWGDIYKWTDEKGGINFSDSPPPAPGKVKNLEVVAKETKPAPTEQALLARIESLERQLQVPRYPAQAPAAQPPMPYGGYPQAMPPPSNYYDSGYDSGYDSSYYAGAYPGYYPTYSYPVVPVYSYAVVPRRAFFGRPAHVARRNGFAHTGGGHRGRR